MIISPRGPRPPAPGIAPKKITVIVDDSVVGQPAKVMLSMDGMFRNALDVAKWLCAAASDCNRRALETPADFLAYQASIETSPVDGINPKAIVVTVDDTIIGKPTSTRTAVNSRVESFNDTARWMCVAAANLLDRMSAAAAHFSDTGETAEGNPREN